jgi:hypothetical protein
MVAQHRRTAKGRTRTPGVAQLVPALGRQLPTRGAAPRPSSTIGRDRPKAAVQLTCEKPSCPQTYLLSAFAENWFSHVWFSDHSICYLELGSLGPGRVRPNGSVGNPRGEVTVFMGYDWLVTGPDFSKSRKDLHPQQKDLETIVEKIIGARVELAIIGLDDDIEISLSTGLK